MSARAYRSKSVRLRARAAITGRKKNTPNTTYAGAANAQPASEARFTAIASAAEETLLLPAFVATALVGAALAAIAFGVAPEKGKCIRGQGRSHTGRSYADRSHRGRSHAVGGSL